MRIGIWLSSLGGSPLQGGLERGLQECGHWVETCNSYKKYDLVIMFNMCAHNRNYKYPEFPARGSPIAFVDTAEYGYFRRLPEVVKNYANAFSQGSISHDTKNLNEQLRLQGFLNGKSFPYFLREMSKYLNYPDGYHPIDYPLYWLSAEPRLPDREEYLRRDQDLFVSWGGSHPWRIKLSAELRVPNIKSRINIIGENGHERIPQGEYFARTRAAKCSVSFDGYGSGSFRMTEVLVRTVLLQGPLSIKTRDPLIDGEHCVAFNIKNQGETFISSDVCEKLAQVLADPERSFEIYQRGYDHCMAEYTERATAAYLLRVVDQHDWGKETDLACL